MKSIKVLIVAPIPKEFGGSYTTGVCNVAYALMNNSVQGITYFLSSSNIGDAKARKLCSYDHQFCGYRWLIKDVIFDVLLHPLRTFREFYTYYRNCHVNPLRYEFLKVNIRNHIKIVKPDIIHVHTTEVPAVYFANYRKIPVVNTYHGIFYRGGRNQNEHGDFLFTSVKQCDYFTGLTKECEYYMMNLLSIPQNRMTIIPNGIDTSVFYYDNEQRSKIRCHFGIDENKIVLITVGSVQERKGQLRFVKYLESLNINYQYWIVGDGSDRQLIDTYIKEHDLTSKVKCLGRINSEELYKYYSAADIYAHTSLMEGQALCEMEAYATGLKIIVNKEIKDTVTTGINNRDIYYILDMDKTNSCSLVDWVCIPNTNRHSRSDTDWRIITQLYADYYRNIINNKK